MYFVEFMQNSGHQALAVWTDPAAGLKAFIAIHDTTLGPALGGKSIWPHAQPMFRSYGRFVDSFNGRYVTIEDVGATAREMEWISYEAPHVVGLPEEFGGSGKPKPSDRIRRLPGDASLRSDAVIR